VADFATALRKRGVHVPSEDLLTQALTHRSAGKRNYERLEFLGDAIVDLLCAELLFASYPIANEGELSRVRAALVDQATLADCARELAIPDHLIVGQGEMKSGGHRRESILADAFEAVVAAIYLEHGMSAARTFVAPLLQSRLAQAESAIVVKDGKSALQEWLQGRGKALPMYELVQQSGPEHERVFCVRCSSEGQSAEAFGASMKRAEQAAAIALLDQLRRVAKLSSVRS
jgi:ribonuclease III